jgi:hypothetical protein
MILRVHVTRVDYMVRLFPSVPDCSQSRSSEASSLGMPGRFGAKTRYVPFTVLEYRTRYIHSTVPVPIGTVKFAMACNSIQKIFPTVPNCSQWFPISGFPIWKCSQLFPSLVWFPCSQLGKIVPMFPKCSQAPPCSHVPCSQLEPNRCLFPLGKGMFPLGNKTTASHASRPETSSTTLPTL